MKEKDLTAEELQKEIEEIERISKEVGCTPTQFIKGWVFGNYRKQQIARAIFKKYSEEKNG